MIGTKPKTAFGIRLSRQLPAEQRCGRQSDAPEAQRASRLEPERRRQGAASLRPTARGFPVRILQTEDAGVLCLL